MIKNENSLQIDVSRICVAGASIGGTLATGLIILNQERNTPQPAFLQLRYPMLDDTHNTPSGSKECYYIWDRKTSFNVWKLYLAGKEVTPLAAPARAKDMSFFPTTYMEICEVDLFRDEDMIFAEKLENAGVEIQYDIFPGVVHAGDVLAPDSVIGKRIMSRLLETVKNGLGL